MGIKDKGKKMKNFFLSIVDINEKGVLSPKTGYCTMDPNGVGTGQNLSPELIWANAPQGTESFAMTCIDVDVPTDFSIANRADVEIPAEMPRQDFVHWLCANIDKNLTSLPSGFMSGDKVMNDADVHCGLTSYSSPDNPKTGYMGPCPPFNDLRLHRYVFTIYALNVKNLDLKQNYDHQQMTSAMKGHILASASAVGVVVRNPKVDKL